MYRDLFSLRDKTVIITGGSGKLGSALTEALLSFGADVTVADVAFGEPALDVTEGRIRRLHCDVSNTESIREMMRQHREASGSLDVLINCAYYGAGYGKGADIEFMSDDVWHTGVDGAAGTVFRCTREAIPHMRDCGGGSIVNIASMYGIVSPDPGLYGDSGANNPPNYGAGKAAVIQFTRYAAAHLAQFGIRSNSVSPGSFPNLDAMAPDFLNRLKAKTMLGRPGQAKELAGAVILLASDASSYMTGTNLTVDGGWTAW